MPRDKTQSHEKIVVAAMREFSQKGFEQASMKSIADSVGMTTAALYRHFDSKQAMFAALVQPAVDALDAWTRIHVDASYGLLDEGDMNQMWDLENPLSDAQMVLDVMYGQPEAFHLLLDCSMGTPYESFLHEKIEEATDRMMEFLNQCIDKGLPARQIQRREMHMLITAYLSAMLEPVEHGYPKEDAVRYLRTIQDFFEPGWRLILGM